MEGQVPTEVVGEMMEWYDGAKNPKAQEIADYVEHLSEVVPEAPPKETFVQGVLFGYFLTTRGYIA